VPSLEARRAGDGGTRQRVLMRCGRQRTSRRARAAEAASRVRGGARRRRCAVPKLASHQRSGAPAPLVSRPPPSQLPQPASTLCARAIAAPPSVTLPASSAPLDSQSTSCVHEPERIGRSAFWACPPLLAPSILCFAPSSPRLTSARQCTRLRRSSLAPLLLQPCLRAM
jgi:hypothetical protein